MVFKRYLPIAPASPARRRSIVAVAAVGVGLAGLTLARRGLDADGVAWTLVVVLLGWIAAVDLLTRRVPNAITLPAAVAVLALRALFARDVIAETALAGVIAFAVFLALAMLMRGGFGMGDVKLAALIGLLLGRSAAEALFIGVLAGGLASLAIFARTRSRRSTLAYAPYLCAGAAVMIVLATDVPALI